MRFEEGNPEHDELRAAVNGVTERAQQLNISLQGRNEAVLEFLLDQLCLMSPERIAFEWLWVERCSTALDEIEGELRKRQLTEGVSLDSLAQGLRR